MNYDGCKKKFDVPAFVSKYPLAGINAVKAGGTTGGGASKAKAKVKGTLSDGGKKK